MPPSPDLYIDLATEKDAAEQSRMFHNAFNNPFFTHSFPNLPESKTWWYKASCTALADPSTHSLVVRDLKDPTGSPIAFARWVSPSYPNWKPAADFTRAASRWEDFYAGCDEELLGALFGSFARNRAHWIGERPHYYLELLGVDEKAKSRGAAGLLVQYGCDLADKDHIECYVDASPEALGLYEKFGFVEKAREEMPGGFGYVETYLVRQPK